MSSSTKKKIREDKEQKIISLKESIDFLDKQSFKFSASLCFEIKFFLISFTTLICTNIYIHKTYLNHYNFKLIILITLYSSRRVLIHLWYHFNIRQYLILTVNSMLITVVLAQLIINVLYILWDLIISNTIYSLLTLFFLSVLQLPMFCYDKHYEDVKKEMIIIIKKVCYLSVEMCYYSIFIPVFFSIKYSPFFNALAIIIYTLFALINASIFLFSFNYFKKAAEFHFWIVSKGHWHRITKGNIPEVKHGSIKQWSKLNTYERDVIVEYKGKYYISLEERNSIEPNDLYLNLLYRLFIKPKEIFFILLTMESVVTLLQLFFYIFTQFNIFSLSLLVTSWYTFYSIYTMLQKIKVIFNK